MNPGKPGFRQILVDFVDGHVSIGDFDASYSRMWEKQRDLNWAALEAAHPQVRLLIRENHAEWERLHEELVRRGEITSFDVQSVLDGIWTDLDVLDQRPHGITEDQLREHCRRAIAQLDELERAATSPDQGTGGAGA